MSLASEIPCPGEARAGVLIRKIPPQKPPSYRQTFFFSCRYLIRVRCIILTLSPFCDPHQFDFTGGQNFTRGWTSASKLLYWMWHLNGMFEMEEWKSQVNSVYYLLYILVFFTFRFSLVWSVSCCDSWRNKRDHIPSWMDELQTSLISLSFLSPLFFNTSCNHVSGQIHYFIFPIQSKSCVYTTKC